MGPRPEWAREHTCQNCVRRMDVQASGSEDIGIASGTHSVLVISVVSVGRSKFSGGEGAAGDDGG